MKTWTKHRALTYILLFALLFVDFSRGFFVLIVRDLLDPSVRDIYEHQLRNLERALFLLQWFGSFPAIAIVVKLNRDQLQKMNIDRFYVFILISAGLTELYKFPYNLFAVIALIYTVYALFDNRVTFGTVDRNSLRVIFLVAGVFAGLTFCITGLVGTVKIELPNTELVDRFVFEIIPGSIYEEAVYRGMLYMFLMDLGVSKSKAFYIQAFLFSIKHMGYLLALPFFFWIILPIHSLLYGYIAMRSKSLTLSTFAHLLYNTWVILTRSSF